MLSDFGAGEILTSLEAEATVDDAAKAQREAGAGGT